MHIAAGVPPASKLPGLSEVVIALRVFLPAHGRIALLTLAALVPCAGLAQSRTSELPPAIERNGVSLGLESPQTPLSATVWLNLHDKATLDAQVRQIYTTGSPSYHHWMTAADLARFQPTSAELALVTAELQAHHLTVVSADPSNLSIKFSGRTSDFEAAFHTQMGRYQVHGRVLRASASKPQLTGAAAGLVRAVTGFAGSGMRPFHAVPVDVKTGKQLGITPLAGHTSSLSPDGAVYSNQCLGPTQTVSLKGPGSTTATYSGISYGASPENTAYGTIGPCGYSPEDVWNLYSLTNVYAAGYLGAGQTVVLIDAYGSPTLTADLETFSQIYGLPAPTRSSFNIYTEPIYASDSGWALETTLDVEWAHAIAPEANLAEVTVATDSDDDLQTGVLYAIDHHLGNVISNSYGTPESEETLGSLITWDEITEIAAAEGISVQFATGDDGDYVAAIGYQDVSTPADTPFATAVGGTTMVFSPAGGAMLETGWGNNITELSPSNSTVDDPPVVYGFQGGSGGGVSEAFVKPTWQSALLGAGRHLPDIAALADPFTGVEVVFTESGTQYIEVVGGTSLATPIISSIWAMVDEYYNAPQGQIAPTIAAGFPLTVDVYPSGTGYNTVGSITDASGKTNYSTYQLSEPLDGVTNFAAGLWNAGGGTYYNISFGTDSSLTITPGWDNVTGYGTLNFAIF